MSDAEGSSRKGQYKIEYSPNNRAACKGPKPCKGTKLSTGEMRLGTVNEVKGHISWAYRHYGCTTSTVFNNMKKAYGAASEVEGFDQLKPEDQEKFTKAWDKGEVEPEDLLKAKKLLRRSRLGPGRSKRQTSDYGDDDDDEEDEPKPKKKAAPRRKKKKADSDDDEDDEDDEDYNVGQKRKRGGKKGSKKKGADDDDY
ncbi:hypothetical protein PIIN_06227 [Serendipita indica DSM 11827]|uniref:PARP-type domain-containing protein n=1 Tax=Serendipita indica (strain DSM 11827) TaxID=1109443 RepID=G4TLV0_SERID|nr:hypothetical protein PIIN_06227 [Serendipita indica DSM 11827]